MLQEDQIKDIGKVLSRLCEFVPTSNAELSRWYDEAERLKTDHWPALKFMPHFFWHYLSDADIRMKDSVYAEMQNDRIQVLLEYLTRGEAPSDDDV